MALAEFFIRAKDGGWTQVQLAKKEGVSETRISNRLVFGRFLAHFFSLEKSVPQNFTEKRFRDYWNQTDSGIAKGARDKTAGKVFPHGFGEEGRFDEVLRLIEEDTVAVQRRPQIGKAIAEHFADGKWHDVPTIAAKIEFPEAADTTAANASGGSPARPLNTDSFVKQGRSELTN